MISTLLILYDTIQQPVANTPTLWDKISTSPIFIILSILGALASIIALLFAVIGIIKKFTSARNWRRKYINSNILDNVLYQYLPEDNTSQKKKTKDDNNQTNSSYKDNIDSNIYIQPYIKTPDNNLTPSSPIQSPELLKDFFIDEVFVRRRDTNIPNYYFLLGDSGSGKTNALVRLFYDYLHHYKHDYTKQEKTDCLPFNIRIFSLREENVFESIGKVNVEKKGCILLLDALDENPMAQKPKESEEYKSFIQQLEKVYTEFAFVITTCRPQFFSEEKEIPDTHNIAKIELVPFNDDQINEFLDKKFNISNEAEKRSKAINLIDKHHEIAKRPIILTYIRDLVNTDRELNTSLDFYDTIAESELRRNISRIQQYVTAKQIRQWWNMTSDVAGYMYKHGKTEISYEELLQILIDHHLAQPNESINEDLFQRRSLLTRTGNSFHFSHKSFYEYFMAYRFLQHPEEIKQVYDMGFALQIYNDALQAWSEQKDSPFAELKKTLPYTVAISLNRVGSALDDINHFSDAERYYQHALVLFRQLEEEKNDTYKDDIAMVLNNLAILHKNTNQLDKAEEEYNEALTTYRQLADKNPDAYLPYVATTLNNLANLYKNTKRYNEAEEEYNKALTIRRQLADKTPDAYLPNVANTLENLAILHSNTDRLQDAEEEYKAVLSIRQKLADKYPDAYLHKVAQTLYNMASLHLDRKEYDPAETAALESLEKYRIMAEKSHAAFDPYVKKAEELLEDIQKAKEADA